MWPHINIQHKCSLIILDAYCLFNTLPGFWRIACPVHLSWGVGRRPEDTWNIRTAKGAVAIKRAAQQSFQWKQDDKRIPALEKDLLSCGTKISRRCCGQSGQQQPQRWPPHRKYSRPTPERRRKCTHRSMFVCVCVCALTQYVASSCSAFSWAGSFPTFFQCRSWNTNRNPDPSHPSKS